MDFKRIFRYLNSDFLIKQKLLECLGAIFFVCLQFSIHIQVFKSNYRLMNYESKVFKSISLTLIVSFIFSSKPELENR